MSSGFIVMWEVSEISREIVTSWILSCHCRYIYPWSGSSLAGQADCSRCRRSCGRWRCCRCWSYPRRCLWMRSTDRRRGTIPSSLQAHATRMSRSELHWRHRYLVVQKMDPQYKNRNLSSCCNHKTPLGRFRWPSLEWTPRSSWYNYKKHSRRWMWPSWVW